VKYLLDPKKVAPLAGPVAVSALVLILYPFVIIFRFCCQCCGGSNRRPDGICCGSSKFDSMDDDEVSSHYSRGSRWCGKIMTLVVVGGGIVGLALMLSGNAQFVAQFHNLFKSILKLLDWADGQASLIHEKMTINGHLQGLNQSFFDEFQSKTDDMRSRINDYENNANSQFMTKATQIAMIVAIVPCALFTLLPLMALCNIRRCIPMLLTLFFWIFCFVFCLVGAVFFTVGSVLGDFCDELTLQAEKKPGIFQWYVVPECNYNAPFGPFKDQVNSVEHDESKKACDELLNICVYNDSVWLPNDQPSKFFYCPDLSNTSIACPNVSGVVHQLDTIIVRTAAISPCNPPYTLNCTMANCATHCWDPSIRDVMSQVLNISEIADHASQAYHLYVEPLLSCDVLLDKALEAFDTCRPFSNAFKTTGAGSIVYGGFFFVGIIVLLRGTKLFHSAPDQVIGDDDEDMDDVKGGRAVDGEVIKKK